MTRRERWIPFAFLIPALAGLLVFQLVPIFFGLGRSLFTVNFASGSGQLGFAGLENFRDIFTDPVFYNALKVTLIFNFFVNPIQIGVSLLIALMLNAKLPGIGVFRTIFYVPVAVSLTIAAIIWGLMLDRDSGMVNGVLSALHLPIQPFLQSPTQALASIMLIVSWQGIAYWMLILLAGLQGIPKSLYEAASIDGATGVQALRHITLPMMRRVLAFVLVSNTVANFLMFGPVFILTRGGPQGSTSTLMFESFRSGFIGINLGRATAITTVILVFIAALVVLQTHLLRDDR